MIYNNVILEVIDESDVEQVRQLLTEQATLSRTEPGCARFEVYHSQSEPLIFLLIEQWDSESHLDDHRKAYAFTEVYQPKVIPLVRRTPHPCDLVA